MCGMHMRHKGKQRADVRGRDGTLLLWCVLPLTCSPVAWWMAETSQVVGATAGAGWRAALIPSCFPSAVCPFLGTQSIYLTTGSLVVLLLPKDKPNGSWGRLWTAVGTDPAFTMKRTAIARSRRFSSQRQKWVWSSAKAGRR